MVLDFVNATYITLIPKVDKTNNSDEYRMISLCNLLYKVVSKIIAERMKPVLGRFVSTKQFGFL